METMKANPTEKQMGAWAKQWRREAMLARVAARLTVWLITAALGFGLGWWLFWG